MCFIFDNFIDIEGLDFLTYRLFHFKYFAQDSMVLMLFSNETNTKVCLHL